jgi:hypothetical protein
MRVSINHLEIGDKVRILNQECADIVGKITNIAYMSQMVEVNGKYEANIRDVRLKL